MTKYDIVVQAEDSLDGPFYQVIAVPNKDLRSSNDVARGDAYARRLFHSNQHGTFLDGYRVKVKPGIKKYWITCR